MTTHASQSWTLTGKVIHVDDGDTLTLLQPDRTKVHIRLSDIDATDTSHGRSRPGQPYSNAYRPSLVGLAGGQQATATYYERAVCTVFANGEDVNAKQLRRGLAWVYGANRTYVRNPNSTGTAARAQAEGVGLWSHKGPQTVPPWVWRRDCWKQQTCDDAGE